MNTCKKDDNKNIIVLQKINGYVQKGPYINGTTINVYELNDSLSQTGKIFNTTITDNKGSFELSNIKLFSQFVELKALGFYFNEITGEKSSAQFALSALSDITTISSINVNILTQLEENRVKYLIKKGLSFTNAKKRTEKEILAIFNFIKNDINFSERLDISVSNDNNAILLAISTILQGRRTVADLTELVANIITDIREDGTLDDEKIKVDLYNEAQQLDLIQIRKNLENRYKELDVDVTIPNFEKYVNAYLAYGKPFNIETQVTNISCHGLSNGSIETNIEEGTPPYTYSWSNGATSENITGIPAGSYSVTVVDKQGYKMVKSNIIVDEPAELVVLADIINPICESNNGSINVSISGGKSPYSYNWSNGANTEDLSDIGVGSYTINILDGNQCLSSKQYALNKQLSNIMIDGKIGVNSIDISVSNGTKPYKYSWSNGQTTEDLYNLSEGRYVVTVIDSNQCSKTRDFNINGTLVDIEGNIYKTITVGTQTWMAENLKTTKYNDGTVIPNINNSAIWDTLKTPAYRWYNDDIVNKNVYGAMYNYQVDISNKICPIGWHIPSMWEWDKLATFLGITMSRNVSKLKESGTEHWITYDPNATNEVGFTAIPGGEYLNSAFISIGMITGWWCGDTFATYSQMEDYINPIGTLIPVLRYLRDNSHYGGFYIRCIKD